MSALAQRYANAACEAVLASQQAEPQAGLDALAEALASFAAMVDDSAALRDALHNPAFKPQRQKAVKALLQKASIGGIAARLIVTLAENERTSLLRLVAEAIEAKADSRAGRLRAWVRSATALSEAQQAALTRVLAHRMGKPVVLHLQLAPEILGGLVCQVGGVTFDTSLKRQLETLTERLGA